MKQDKRSCAIGAGILGADAVIQRTNTGRASSSSFGLAAVPEV